DGKTLATVASPPNQRDQSSTIVLWNVTRGKKIRQFDTVERGIQALAFSPDGRLIVSANRDQTVSLWECITGKECCQLKLDNRAAELPADAQSDLEKNGEADAAAQRRPAAAAPPAALSIAIAADGRTLAVGSVDRTIRLFDLMRGTEVGRFNGH